MITLNPARGLGQAEAQEKVGYGPINIRRLGGNVIVEIEYMGAWVEVIREALDSNFCHCIEPSGILACLDPSDKGVQYSYGHQ